MAEEKIILISERMRLYNSGKPKETRIGTFLGKLIITSERFLFLSSGSSKILSEMLSNKLIFRGLIGELFFGKSLTKDLNLKALNNKGSIVVRLNEIENIKASKKFPFVKYLAVKLMDKEICFMDDAGGLEAPVLKLIEEAVINQKNLISLSNNK